MHNYQPPHKKPNIKQTVQTRKHIPVRIEITSMSEEQIIILTRIMSCLEQTASVSADCISCVHCGRMVLHKLSNLALHIDKQTIILQIGLVHRHQSKNVCYYFSNLQKVATSKRSEFMVAFVSKCF